MITLHFKPDFSIDNLRANNYICHLCVVETAWIQKLQIRKQYDGAQDYDLVLRIVSSLMLKEKENSNSGRVEDYICLFLRYCITGDAMKAQRRIIHRARCMRMRQAERHWLILPSAWAGRQISDIISIWVFIALPTAMMC